ncbi:MAG: precorrin-4 C(11)-methyltransferase [Verrucomicrobiota bacterium]
MKVFFIGAGPGAKDLITVRGARILGEAQVVLYAGSLVAEEVLEFCQDSAEIINTAGIDLEEQMKLYEKARAADQIVARLHSGDPAIYGAVAEQMRRLDELGIEYEVVPGVSTFCSSAASLKCELTKPGIAQSIIITRAEGRASSMPEGESLESLASHGTTMAIFLSGARLPETVEALRKHYPEETRVALVQKNEWPEEKRHQSTLGQLLDEIRPSDWRLSTMLLVGDVLGVEGGDSRLYDPVYSHHFRKGRR